MEKLSLLNLILLLNHIPFLLRHFIFDCSEITDFLFRLARGALIYQVWSVDRSVHVPWSLRMALNVDIHENVLLQLMRRCY